MMAVDGIYVFTLHRCYWIVDHSIWMDVSLHPYSVYIFFYKIYVHYIKGN